MRKTQEISIIRAHSATDPREVTACHLSWTDVGRSWGRPGWTDGAIKSAPCALLSEALLRRLVGIYNADPESSYNRVVRLCEECRGKGFVALARPKQGGEIIPLQSLEAVQASFGGLPLGREITFGPDGGAYPAVYQIHGNPVELVTLFEGEKPLNAIRPLRRWLVK